MPVDPELPEPLPSALAGAAGTAEQAVAADQAAAHAGEKPPAPQGHHGPFHSHCENCGTKLEGPWCHRCGQHDFEFHRSFRHVFWEALESFFHFEGKFFQNIVVLLFRPGRLTADFNAGKRASQMPPFRLYIFVSLLFFFLLLVGSKPATDALRFGPGSGASLTRNGEVILGTGPDSVAPADAATPPPVPAAPPATPPVVAPLAVQQAVEVVLRDLEKENDPQRAVDRLRRAAEEIQATAAREPAGGPAVVPLPAITEAPDDGSFTGLLGAQARRATTPEGQRQMVQSFFTALPKMLLFCVPFFALYTRVLFRKSGQVYLQHLVLALHFHTFIYLFVLFRDGWGFLAGLTGTGLRSWVLFASNLWLFVYPFLMLRRLFAGSWPATVFKTLALGVAYAFTLLVGFLVTALILFLML